MKYYIGLDLGTSGVKGVVYDENAEPVGSFLEEYNILSPKNGYAEENPEDWFSAAVRVLKKISALPCSAKIRGLALSGQMHGLVLLDKEDRLLRNSIIWCDNRTEAEAKQISDAVGLNRLKEITGNISMAPFTLAKLLWVKNNEPEIYCRIHKVMLPKDYLVYRFTKQFVSEYSDASGMQIMDIEKLEYSEEILNCFHIPSSWFGKLVRSEEKVGFFTEEMEQLTGLSHIFVCAGAGDQAAGALGNGILDSTDASVVLGSSGVVYAPTEHLYIAAQGEIQTFSTALKGRYHVMGVTNGCGTSLKWLRDNVFHIDYTQMTMLAEKEACGSNGLFYLPYLMGERTPILDANATGIFLGIKNTTSTGQMIRAVMEGVGYSIKDCFNLIPCGKTKILISGGGAKSKLFREIIASMIHMPVMQIKQNEGPSLGAAVLAMVADGIYSDFKQACEKIIQPDTITYPYPKWENVYDEGYRIYKKIYENNKKIYKDIKEMQENEIF